MSTKTIEDLRAKLFDAIDGVRNGTLDVERARIVSELSQVIVNSAKVEVDFVRATERRGSAFLGTDTAGALPPPANGIVSVRRHLLKDD